MGLKAAERWGGFPLITTLNTFLFLKNGLRVWKISGDKMREGSAVLLGSLKTAK